MFVLLDLEESREPPLLGFSIKAWVVLLALLPV